MPRGRRVRLRARPAPRTLAVVVAVPLVLAGAYVAARETSTFAIRSVSVDGGTPAVQAQVQAAVEPFVGKSLLALDGRAIVRRVDALPTVVSASYDRAFPHTLRISVVPERPVAVLRRGLGSWLLSARGRAIARLAGGARPALPRVWVPTTVQVAAGTFLAPEDGAIAARALALASGFPARISTAAFAHGELAFRLRSGLELRLGEPTDLRLKLAVARRALRLLPVGTTYLDVAVPQRPVAGADSQLSGKA